MQFLQLFTLPQMFSYESMAISIGNISIPVYCLLFMVKIFHIFADYFATVKVFGGCMHVNTMKSRKSR